VTEKITVTPNRKAQTKQTIGLVTLI